MLFGAAVFLPVRETDDCAEDLSAEEHPLLFRFALSAAYGS